VFFHVSLLGKSTRKRQIRRNLSEAIDTTAADVIPQVSPCCATNDGNETSQNFHTETVKTVTAAKRSCSARLVRHHPDEASSDAVTTRMSSAEENETNFSESSVGSSRRLGKSSCAKTVKSSGSVPVVEKSDSATAVAAAAMAACVVVIRKTSSVSERCIARNKSAVNSHSEKVRSTSRGKRHRCEVADHDVEPDEATVTNSSSASCK